MAATSSWRRSPQQQPPPRVTEADIRRADAARRLPGAAGAAPTTVLSLWQPLASFLAHGLQRVEGRGWSTEFRGPLWIHAGSKKVSPEDIAKWEALYRDVFAADGNTGVKFPDKYPTSALVGLVEVVDVVTADEFSSWNTLPRGVRREGRSHGSGSLFLIQKHRRLPVPLKMSGQHKLWRLDQRVAEQVFPHLISSEQGEPVDFARHRGLAQAAAEKGGGDDIDDGDSDDDGDDQLDTIMLELALQRSLADSEASVVGACGASRQLSKSEDSEDNSMLGEALRISVAEAQALPKASPTASEIARPSPSAEEHGTSIGNVPGDEVAGARRRGRWGRGRAGGHGVGSVS